MCEREKEECVETLEQTNKVLNEIDVLGIMTSNPITICIENLERKLGTYKTPGKENRESNESQRYTQTHHTYLRNELANEEVETPSSHTIPPPNKQSHPPSYPSFSNSKSNSYFKHHHHQSKTTTVTPPSYNYNIPNSEKPHSIRHATPNTDVLRSFTEEYSQPVSTQKDRRSSQRRRSRSVRPFRNSNHLYQKETASRERKEQREIRRQLRRREKVHQLRRALTKYTGILKDIQAIDSPLKTNEYKREEERIYRKIQ